MDTQKIETLERLGKLLDDGRISQAEYQSLKDELITGPVLSTFHADDNGNESTSADSRVDFYQRAVEGEIEVETPGWYPDPRAPGTHTRFYDGESWTESVRERKSPGWYRDTEQIGRERYFNGLEYTYEYRSAPATQPPTPSAISHQARANKDWRFWVGLVLVILGAIAVLNGLARFNVEPIQSVEVFIYTFAIDPLIWGGVIGAFMLFRWKQAAAPSAPVKTVPR